jgi:P4 family phage/plasmid primase-like protien
MNSKRKDKDSGPAPEKGKENPPDIFGKGTTEEGEGENEKRKRLTDTEFAQAVADYLMTRHHYITRATAVPDPRYIWVADDDYVYRPAAELFKDAMEAMTSIVDGTDAEALDYMPRDVDFPDPKSATAREVQFQIIGMTAVDRDFFDENPEHIPVNNGVLEFFETKKHVKEVIRDRLDEAIVKTKDPAVKSRAEYLSFQFVPEWDLKIGRKWSPHLEEMPEVTVEDVKERGAKIFIQKIPVDYDPEADCPAFKKFLEDVVPDTRDRMTVQEMFGALLWRAPVGKAFVLIGEGANGKSTLLSVMEDFLGKRNTTAHSLQDISKNKFALSDLVGKLADFGAELPSSRLENSDVFKSLVTGDPLPAEKKYEMPFPFRNYAKLIFATNQMPSFADVSSAFYRRWVIINFPNRFMAPELVEAEKKRMRNEGQSEEEIERQTANLKVADPFIKQKITTPQELSGILNWALAGLKRLIDHGFKFTSETIPEETGEEMQKMIDPVKSFLDDEVEITNNMDDYVLKESLYNRYTAYCRQKKLWAVTNVTFFKRLRMIINYSETQLRTAGNKRVVLGLKFLSEDGDTENRLVRRQGGWAEEGREGKEKRRPPPLSLFCFFRCNGFATGYPLQPVA